MSSPSDVYGWDLRLQQWFEMWFFEADGLHYAIVHLDLFFFFFFSLCTGGRWRDFGAWMALLR